MAECDMQVERQKLKVNMNAARTLKQNWTGLAKEYFITIWEEVCLAIQIDA